MSNKHKDLLIIGPIPEPKGGVSIHIIRLKNLLNSNFNITYVDESPIQKPGVFNLRSKNICTYLKIVKHSDIVHIHSGVTLLRIIHILVSKVLFKKIIVTLHAFPHNKGYHVLLNKLFLKLADHIIVVNSEIPKKLGLNKFLLKPAFIPPNLKKEHELPLNIKEWILNRKESGNIILTGNAFRIDFHEGLDLYGIDLCIDAVNILVNDHNINICLIFILATLSKSHDSFNNYQSLIKKKRLENNILLIQQNVSFVKLIEKCDIILRPTCTDGDALTVREALYLGKPIIASNVITRPTGTVLFENRNSKDLASKIIHVINNKSKATHNHEPLSTYCDFYLNLYKN